MRGDSMNKKYQQNDKLQELMDKLQDGVKEVFISQRYADYLKVMSRFHHYSYRNSLLIAMQNPNATMVASYTRWKELGRFVNRGEKAIQIMAPSSYKKKEKVEVIDEETQMPIRNPDGSVMEEEVEVVIPAFRAASVFDVSQTNGEPLPSLFSNIEGDVEQFSAFMKAVESISPVPIEYANLMEEDGYYHQLEKKIVLRDNMSQRQTAAAVIHEVSHAMLHALDMDNLKESLKLRGKDQKTMEVEAESIAYVVCQHYGIETGENSFGYIAMWSNGKELPELHASLETIRDTAAKLIDGIDEKMKELLEEVKKTENQKEQEVVIENKQEERLLFGKENQYGIYQHKEDGNGRVYTFMGMDYVERNGIKIEKSDYNLVYTGELKRGETLDSIYEKFNINHPDDFRGHSLSVSDVIVLNENGKIQAFYVDTFGFQELPTFLEKELFTERSVTEAAYQIGDRYFLIQEATEGYDYTFYNLELEEIDGGIYDDAGISLNDAMDILLEEEGLSDKERIQVDYDELRDRIDVVELKQIEEARIQYSKGNKAEYLEYYAAECDEFHDMGEFYVGSSLKEIADRYREILQDPRKSYMGNGMGIIYHNSQESLYDGAEMGLISGKKIYGDRLDLIPFLSEQQPVRMALEQIREEFPDYSFIPPNYIRDSLYPEHMDSMELAEAIDQLMQAFDQYDYRDSIDDSKENVYQIATELEAGNVKALEIGLKEVIENDDELTVRAAVLLERIKTYHIPEKDIVQVKQENGQQESSVMNRVCKDKQDSKFSEDLGKKLSIHEKIKQNKEKIRKGQVELLQKKTNDLGRV